MMLWFFIIPVLPYFIILLFIRRYLASAKSYFPHTYNNIKVSVVVACRNEEQRLPFLLECLSEQDFKPDLFEVIIADDNSSDKTALLASSFNKIQNLRVVRNEGTGKKAAIRTGILAAANDLIITTDADCLPPKGWLRSIASFYYEKNPDMIIGQVILEGKDGFFNGFQQLEFLSLQGITAGTAESGNAVMCNGANLAFKKDVYIKLSGNLHDEIASGDDVFLLHSLKKIDGSKILLLNSAESIVTTSPSDSLNSFLKQRSRWISKAGAYRDRLTQTLGIVTFVTIFVQLFLLFYGIFNQQAYLVYATVLIIKSVPDFLILYKSSVIHKKSHLLKWFIPSQIVYPFYVMAVLIYSLSGNREWR